MRLHSARSLVLGSLLSSRCRFRAAPRKPRRRVGRVRALVAISSFGISFLRRVNACQQLRAALHHAGKPQRDAQGHRAQCGHDFARDRRRWWFIFVKWLCRRAVCPRQVVGQRQILRDSPRWHWARWVQQPSDGLRTRFPKYTYDDMVVAQHRLLTEHLGVNHLRLIMGTSMGCMHGWVWGYTYPQFMDGLAPYACVPAQIAGRNRMIRTMAMDAIRNDPAWKNGDYTSAPPGLRAAQMMLYIMSSAPLVQQTQAPTQRQSRFRDSCLPRCAHGIDRCERLSVSVRCLTRPTIRRRISLASRHRPCSSTPPTIR